MKEDIDHYVCMCIKCQSTKSIHKKKFGLYRPFPIPLSPFENVSMDCMTSPGIRGDGCHLCGGKQIFKISKVYTAPNKHHMVGMAKLFFDMWVQHNWMLEVIVSDWDVKFMSEFWMLLMKKANRSKNFASISICKLMAKQKK